MRKTLLLALLSSVGLLDAASLGSLVVRDAANSATPTMVVGVLTLHLGLAAAGAAGVVTLATALASQKDVDLTPLDRRASLAIGGLALAFGVFLPAIAIYLGFVGRRIVPVRAWDHLDPAEIVDRAPRRTAHRNVVVSELFATLSDRSAENAEHRFQTLLLTRFLPPRQAILVLKLALKDPSDEVRLFAFSRIERFRSSIESNIKALEQARIAGGDDAARVVLRLAENHWELAYL